LWVSRKGAKEQRRKGRESSVFDLGKLRIFDNSHNDIKFKDK
jgi:hypothetical protein